MLNSNWRSIRIGLLAVTFVGTVLVWARVAAIPKSDENTARRPDNTLQASVPIEGWQLIGSEPIDLDKVRKKGTNEELDIGELKDGRRYRYQQNKLMLEADQIYAQSDGNVSRYLFVYSPIRTANANLKIKFQPGVGHYGLVGHQNKAYLSACINPRGMSTVTESQFTQNRYSSDLQISRIFPWLLGQESLIDYRCLWTVMSIPLNESGSLVSQEKTYQALETAWFSWYQWWQGNFPPPPQRK